MQCSQRTKFQDAPCHNPESPNVIKVGINTLVTRANLLSLKYIFLVKEAQIGKNKYSLMNFDKVMCHFSKTQ